MTRVYHYFLLHKPYGYLSQFTPDHPGQKTLADLFAFPPDVYAVGRLDLDSEGLLLLTNDKRLNHLLLDPRRGHWRTYCAQVEGIPEEHALQALRSGLTIAGKSPFTTRPCKARIIGPPNLPPRIPPIRVRATIPDSWIEVQLQEGKNRQVRRMLAAIGHPVLRLMRTAIEGLELGNLGPGEVHELKQREVYAHLNIK